jgi:hypothetical protein
LGQGALAVDADVLAEESRAMRVVTAFDLAGR